MEYVYITNRPYYYKYASRGYYHLIRCRMKKSQWHGYGKGNGYKPVDPKHIWLMENMKSGYGPKRYVFNDSQGTRWGVIFLYEEDAMAFKLRWT